MLLPYYKHATVNIRSQRSVLHLFQHNSFSSCGLSITGTYSPYFPSHSLTTSPGENTFEVKIVSPVEQFTRIWTQVLDRRDGSFLVRYRMYATYTDLHIHVLLKSKSKHVAKSPFILQGRI